MRCEGIEVSCVRRTFAMMGALAWQQSIHYWFGLEWIKCCQKEPNPTIQGNHKNTQNFIRGMLRSSHMRIQSHKESSTIKVLLLLYSSAGVNLSKAEGLDPYIFQVTAV
ncbi:alpha-tocopherol transfer protein-like [Striga asiatica]|uniref:Alpha-tocopherol transfer protein-like n=1 Tax=Striga asiatica TaxID=4170 RepID=A0A5A7QB87_STRAF|nr:alpha-tocopherol transfer protein-like [Striga asiatica]